MVHTRDLVGFADDMLAAYQHAADVVDEPFEHSVRLADRVVRLRFASPRLAARLWPAFASLEDPSRSAEADLSISCWEGAATAVAPPSSPFALEDFLPRGLVRGHIDNRIRVTYEPAMQMLTVYDRDRRESLVYVVDQKAVPAWVDRAPFRTVIRWWADDRSLVALHASAVATDGGGVAVSGRSGSGKSTTALACVAAGWRFIADDLCLVTPGPEPSVHPVYGLAKLEPDALERLPDIARLVVDPTADQLVVRPTAEVTARAPLRALLLARIVPGAVTRISPLLAGEALRSLVPGSVLEGVGAGTQSLALLGALLRQVPCRRLELGRDLHGVVDAIRDVVVGSP